MIDENYDIDDLSLERKALAFDRAEREFGGCVVDHYSEAFLDEFSKQMYMMLVKDTTAELLEFGLVDVEIDPETGERIWTVNDKGRRALEEHDARH